MIGMTPTDTPDKDSIWSQAGPQTAARWLGLLLFIGVGFLYLVSGLLAPIWASTILIGLWLLMLVTIVKVWRTRPWLVLSSPVIALTVWVLVLLAGEFFLGWSA